MTPHVAGRAGLRLRIAATRVDDWLALGADLPGAAPPLAPWTALRCSAASPGPAKFVLNPQRRSITLRADVPAEDGFDVATRSREARDGMVRLACRTMAHEDLDEDGAEDLSRDDHAGAASCDGDADAPSTEDHAVAFDPAALAAESGWPFVRRASGRLAVDLAVPGQFCEAMVEPRRSGGCRARVELARLGDVPDQTRSALAVLLLTVAGVVRCARAGAEPVDGMTHVFVEVDIESAATAAELHHALAALSVACRMARREVHALMDPDVARTYLAARGWAES